MFPMTGKSGWEWENISFHFNFLNKIQEADALLQGKMITKNHNSRLHFELVFSPLQLKKIDYFIPRFQDRKKYVNNGKLFDDLITAGL